MKIYRITNTIGLRGGAWDQEFHSQNDAANALRAVMGWVDIALSAPFSSSDSPIAAVAAYGTLEEQEMAKGVCEPREWAYHIEWQEEAAVDNELTIAFKETADDMIEAIGRACSYVIEKAKEADAAARAGTISQQERNCRIGKLTGAWAHLGELLEGSALTLEETASVVRLFADINGG